MDEPEDHVVHRPTLGNRDAEREVRDRALRVLRPVDRIDADGQRSLALDPDLLGDDPDVGQVEVLQDDALRGLVERSGDVAALATADRPLALLARRHLDENRLNVANRRAAQLQPGAQTGWSNSPEVNFGRK